MFGLTGTNALMARCPSSPPLRITTRLGCDALLIHLSNSLDQLETNELGHTTMNRWSRLRLCRANMVVIVISVLPSPDISLLYERINVRDYWVTTTNVGT